MVLFLIRTPINAEASGESKHKTSHDDALLETIPCGSPKWAEFALALSKHCGSLNSQERINQSCTELVPAFNSCILEDDLGKLSLEPICIFRGWAKKQVYQILGDGYGYFIVYTKSRGQFIVTETSWESTCSGWTSWCFLVLAIPYMGVSLSWQRGNNQLPTRAALRYEWRRNGRKAIRFNQRRTHIQ